VPKVVNVMKDVLITKANQHNDLVKQTIQKGIQYPYSIEMPLPKTAPAGNQGILNNIDSNSLDAILRSRGALK